MLRKLINGTLEKTVIIFSENTDEVYIYVGNKQKAYFDRNSFKRIYVVKTSFFDSELSEKQIIIEADKTIKIQMDSVSEISIEFFILLVKYFSMRQFVINQK